MNGGKRWLRFGVSGLIVVLAVYFVWRNWADLQASIEVVRTIPAGVFAVAIAGVLLTFVLAALSYRMLVLRRVALRELLLVEFAAAFINRIVPSGLGGLGVHGLYLHKRKHTTAQATTVVSVNNLLGIATHMMLFAALLLFVRLQVATKLQFSVVQMLVVVLCLVAVLVVGGVPVIRRRIARFWRNMRASLVRYRNQPHMLVFAGLGLMALTLTNLLVLFLLAQTVGIWLSLPQLFMVYSVGVLFGTLMPTPGGLVGVEAGLVAGFAAYGVPADSAIAAALAYRLVTYWFPLLPGVAAWVAVRHRDIV